MSENFTAELPERFTRNVLDLCGEAGGQWLNDLPQIIERLSAVWQLEVLNPFSNLSYNFVAPCLRADGEESVLKIALPLDKPEIFNEAKFLQAADGKGAVKILKIEENLRAILLERLVPGANLKEVCRQDDAQAVEIAVTVMRGLLKRPPPNCDFPNLNQWFDNFFSNSPATIFPAEYQNKTREIYELLSSASEQKFLLHGDLHHENILSATCESFLAIDPKGIVGDIGYEIAVFLNNHLWWLTGKMQTREKLDKAVRRFSESFAIEQDDLRKWAYAQIVLSAWWTFEDNGANWETDLAFAEFWDINWDIK